MCNFYQQKYCTQTCKNYIKDIKLEKIFAATTTK